MKYLNCIYLWLGKLYDLFKKNCNHFTKFFACLLLRTHEVLNFPEYVNRITIFAQYFSGFYKPIKKLCFESSNSITSSLNSESMNNGILGNNINNNVINNANKNEDNYKNNKEFINEYNKKEVNNNNEDKKR